MYRLMMMRDYNVGSNLSEELRSFLYIIPYNILLFVMMLIILKASKLKLKAIGINFKTLPKSLLVGLVVAVPILAYKILVEGLFEEYDGINILWVCLYFATYMFIKELMYRGLIQPRIVTLVGNKWLGIAIVALMFSVLTASGMNFELEDFLVHFVLVYVFNKYDNVAGSFLIYFAWNIY